MKTSDEFLEKLYATVVDGKRTDAIDSIYNTLDDWLIEGKFEEVSQALRDVDLSKIDIAMMLSMIIVTRPAATFFMSKLDGAPRIGNVTGRKEFYERAKAFVFQEEGPDRLESLFGGLDPSKDEAGFIIGK